MKKIFGAIAAVLTLAACEKEVTVDIPVKDPKLVISGFLPKDSVVRVFVSRSRNVLDPKATSFDIQNFVVTNARVILYEGTQVIDTLVYNTFDYYYFSPKNRTVGLGKTYRLQAEAPGFSMAEVTTTVPSQSTLADVTRVKNARTNSDGNKEDEITIKLDDPGNEKNFYLIQFLRPTFGWGGGYPIYCVSTTDKDIEPIGENADPLSTDNCYDGESLLMRDDNFNGKQKILRFYINSYDLEEQPGPGGQVYRAYVKVSRITEDHFKYVKSYNVYYNSSDNPFAEPANVFTNVKNGYGLVTAFTSVSRELN